MRLLWRLLRRDLAEFASSAPLLILVLAVPLFVLLLIGQLNVRPPLTRLAIVTEAGPSENAEWAQERLRERLREIAGIEWVEWTADAGDLRERAVRERVDIVLVHSGEEWRAYSALTRAARAASAQEVAQLLMLSLQRERRADQQLERLNDLVAQLGALDRQLGPLRALGAKLSAPEQRKALAELARPANAQEQRTRQDEMVALLGDLVSAAAQVETPTSSLDSARDLQQSARREAALPTSLQGVWLSAQLAQLWAPASVTDHALVPGYIALIAVFVPFVLASSALVREREAVTLHGLLVAVRRRWLLLIVGKLLLPVLAGLLAVALLLATASVAFGFGVKPGLATALLVQSLAAAVSAVFGMVVSTLIESAQEAYAVSAAYLVGLILLTGMIHPLEQSAPAVVAVAQLFPLTLSAPALEAWMLSGAAAWVPPQTWVTLGMQGLAALLLCAEAIYRLKARL